MYDVTWDPGRTVTINIEIRRDRTSLFNLKRAINEKKVWSGPIQNGVANTEWEICLIPPMKGIASIDILEIFSSNNLDICMDIKTTNLVIPYIKPHQRAISIILLSRNTLV